jgi:hypothetical protein
MPTSPPVAELDSKIKTLKSMTIIQEEEIEESL